MDIKNVEATFRLSPTQQAILNRMLGERGGERQIDWLTHELFGDLDADRLNHAFQQVVDGLPALRTLVVWQGMAKPLQILCRKLPVKAEVIDWSQVPDDRLDERVERFLAENLAKPLEPNRPPLCRLSLCRTGRDHCWLVLTWHRLVLDQRSARLVLDNVLRALDRQPLAVSEATYQAYLTWLGGLDRAAAEAFWASIAPPADAGPTLRKQAARGERVLSSSELNSAESAALRDFCARLDIMPETLVLAGIAAVFNRLGLGACDLKLQVDPHRFLPTGKIPLGPLPDAIPFGLTPGTADGVDEWVSRVRGYLESARRYLPCLEAAETAGFLPGILVRVDPVREQPYQSANLSLGRQATSAAVPDLSLVVRCGLREAGQGDAESREAGPREAGPREAGQREAGPREAGSRWRVEVDGDMDCFDEGLLHGLAETMSRFLVAMSRTPQARMLALPLLSDHQRRKLLEDWNQEMPNADELPVHQAIALQARATPDAIALIHDPAGRFEQPADLTRLTYAEINERANQLAHHLLAMGVGAEVTVAVFMDRCPEAVICALAIFKAGGVFMPLDPDQPYERAAAMIEDGQPAVMLILEAFEDRLPATWAQVLMVDADWDDLIAFNPSQDPATLVHSDNLAYLIFTSGSTGKPKASRITTGAMANLCHWYARYFDLGPGVRVIQAVPVGFDASIKNVFAPLMVGGTCVLAANGPYDDQILLRTIQSQAVALMNCVPSMFYPLVELAARQDYRALESLRYVALGGEPTDLDRLRPWFRSPACGAVFVNIYGPTEAADTALAWRATDQINASRAPIGEPISGVRIYILGPQMDLLPPGVAGNLMIAGRGLARDYLNRPDLTAACFLPNPFAAGERLYDTGDRAVWQPDGRVRFLGRRDYQIKRRGFRIEPGEIEQVLLGHAAVREAVVAVRESNDGSSRLVAYYVADRTRAAEPDELRDFVSAKLPAYMVPDLFFALETMPLTNTGKIDREALPEPAAEHLVARLDYQAPGNWIEEQVALIWAGLLNLPRIGTHDRFFDLGGHSLLATQVISRIRDIFSVELSLQDFFQSPTIVHLARCIQAAVRLADDQDSLIAPVPRQQVMPASFAQRRLWFLDRLEGANPAYIVHAALGMRGQLRVDALERAAHALAMRHEVLRTTFTSENGEPVQHIHPEPLPFFEFLDFVPLSAAERQVASEQHVSRKWLRPMDLESGPLARIALLRQEESDYILVITLHHIISDAWSMGILVRELTALYAGFATDRNPDLPALPLQYADYAAWQRRWLDGGIREKQQAYWLKQLAGAPSLLDLPTDRPRPPVQTANGDYLAVLLEADNVAQLEKLGRAHGATLFMTLLAGFNLLASRYSGQQDICLGVPVANRNRREIEGLIGFFVNALVVRIDLAGNPRFSDLLEQVRRVTIEAYQNQDLPFEQLVEALQPARNRDRSPLFQVMIGFGQAESADLGLPGIDLHPIPVEDDAAKFDITVALDPTPEGMLLGFEFNTDLFDRGTINALAGRYRELLIQLAREPHLPIDRISLLTPAETALLHDRCRGREVPLPVGTFVELFARRVAERPEAIALLAWNEAGRQQMTYRQLDTASNRLAHYLRASGLRIGEPVGLCLLPDCDMIISLLAVLKAGGVYLPLDPQYPTHRLAFLLQDSGMQYLITQSEAMAALPGNELNFIQTLVLDEEREILEREPETALAWLPDMANPAYIIYTSGSTGQPKAVLLHHQGLANMAVELAEGFRVSRGDRVLQFASASFDASVSEIGTALGSGATLLLIPAAKRLPGKELAAFLRDQQVTHLTLPPSVLAQMPAGEYPALKALIVAGEACPPALTEAWLEGRHFVNAYGPTEATVCTTFRPCLTPKDCRSIGTPIGNMAVHVLDRAFHLAPAGVFGELCLAGIGLARGYRGRPDLTAAAFVPNPFGAAGERMYRSGDRVRLLEDGHLHFAGRIDDQIKLRGFRIELGEIEAVLSQHPQVQEAVVLVRSDRSQDAKLIAWYRSAENGSLEPPELRDYLAAHLPEYMRPVHLVSMPAMPLTTSGKIDRKALPDPGFATRGQGPARARDLVELQLIDIWEEVLRLEGIGVHDNFFEIGGHSLVATRLLALIEARFQVEIQVHQLFQAPTVAELAGLLRTGGGDASCPLVPLRKSGERAPLFLVHPIGGDIFCYASLARALPADLPVYGLRSPHLQGRGPAGLEQMAGAYVAAIRARQPQGPYRLAGWSLGGLIAHEMASQLEAAGASVSYLALIDTYPPNPLGDLEAYTLIRYFITDLGGLHGQDLAELLDRLDPAQPDQFLDLILQASRERGLLPGYVEHRQLEAMWATFQAHFRMQAGYEPRPFAGEMHYIRAATAVGAADGGMLGFLRSLRRNVRHAASDPRQVWRALASGLVEHSLPADHHGILAPPIVFDLAAIIREGLREGDSETENRVCALTEAGG